MKNGDMQNIYDRIVQAYGGLTRSERKIADFLFQHKAEVQNMTITEMAAASAVSEATITRFCRNIGAFSFNDFRRALTESQPYVYPNNSEMSDLYERIHNSDSIEVKKRKLCQIGCLALQKTRDLLDAEAVARAVDMMTEARQVLCMGQGNSSIVAYDVCGRFCSVSTKFHWVSDAHLQTSYAAIAGAGDLFLYFSFSAATEELWEVGRLLQDSEAKLILVTRFPNMESAKLADLLLICGADESPQQVGSVAAKIGQLYLIDVLYNEYCSRDPQQSYLNKMKSAAATREKLRKS